MLCEIEGGASSGVARGHVLVEPNGIPPDAQICSFAKEVTELGMIPQETRSLVHSI